MSGAQSISTRRAYGVQRVCRVWHCARSSVYARRQATPSPAPNRRRGPIGAAPDDVLVGPPSPGTRSLAVLWRGVPEGLGEAAGRRDSDLEGTGAAVDAGARPPGPAARGPRARAKGTRRDHLFGVKYFCRSTSTILAGFGRLLVRRRTVRWALLRVLKTQKTKRRERPLGDVHGVR